MPFGTMQLTGNGLARVEKALGTENPFTVEELAEAVGLKEKTVQLYLGKLMMRPGYSQHQGTYRFDRRQTTNEALLKVCTQRLRDYPKDHPERPKIEAQIRRMKGEE